MFLVSVTITIIIIYYLINYFKNASLNHPPGPIGLPFVGYLPFLEKESFRTFQSLSKKYGNILSLRMGTSNVVVLNDYPSVKEALNNSSMLARPPKFFGFHPGGMGFASADGNEWIEQRRYVMKILKDIGLGNFKWEEDVEAEAGDFVRVLSESAGQPVEVLDHLSISLTNNMATLVLGKRLSEGDPAKKIVDDAVNSLSIVFNQAGWTMFFPELSKLLARIGSKFGKEFSNMANLNELIRKTIESRKYSTEREENEFIDDYLKEKQELKEKNIQNTFSEYNLAGNIQAIIYGGSETTRTSILWLYLAMAAHPQIQKKVQEEIDRVIGRDGTGQWSQRKNFPYTFAAIMEVQRWRTLAPFSLMHRASEDTKIGGFDIPKDTYIMPNTWALHNDTTYWTDPHKFIPDRFLSEDGSLQSKRPESYLPFSSGRRICPGETVGLMEIFKYFTTTLQKFSILPIENVPLNLGGNVGVTYHPHLQKLRFVPRD